MTARNIVKALERLATASNDLLRALERVEDERREPERTDRQYHAVRISAARCEGKLAGCLFRLNELRADQDERC